MNRMDEPDRPDDERPWEGEADELERASENVFEGWPADDASGEAAAADEPFDTVVESPPFEPVSTEDVPEPFATEEIPEPAGVVDDAAGSGEEVLAPEHPVHEVHPTETSSEHAPGVLTIPPGYPVLEGEARGGRRAVGIVVSRFNGEVTGRLLDSALEELRAHDVDAGSVTIMPVPGAFELPIAAMALAKTRRFACVVALGCVIRGDTRHFDYVASEAASGLQLAAIETGVPVSFGVLTLDRPDQAEPRVDKGAEAVRTALEMADLFSNLRAAAAR
jgi:6,7-dimethyl-8-ribityllumazine synthase